MEVIKSKEHISGNVQYFFLENEEEVKQAKEIFEPVI
jgi:hypothetical protein